MWSDGWFDSFHKMELAHHKFEEMEGTRSPQRGAKNAKISGECIWERMRFYLSLI